MEYPGILFSRRTGGGRAAALGTTRERACLPAGSDDREHGLVVPGNITLLELPPYSPELNPVERIWHDLRSHWLANSVFISLADIMDACEMAWNRFAPNHGLIRSLCAVPWGPASLAL